MNPKNWLPVLSLLCLWQLDLEVNEALYDEQTVQQPQLSGENQTDAPLNELSEETNP